MGGAGGPRSVLMIDDDEHVRAFIRSRLVAHNMTMTEASSGERGLELMDDSFDVVLVDVGLPGIDGFDVVRSIRKRHSTPIMMITAATDEADRVLGLELGADDYIVKPFLPREFVARVRALIRRSGNRAPADASTVTFGEITIDPHAQEVVRGEITLRLTRKEYDLLWFLANSPREVFTRDDLLKAVWHTEPDWQLASTVTEHVHRVRRHIEIDPSKPLHVTTVRGVGYRFDP